MWAAAFGVARLTRNVILLPTIVLLGSFLVPVTAVVWYLDHDPSPALSPRRILAAFIIAGVFGVLGASLLEYWLVNVGILGSLEVGLIEEAVKGIFIAVVALGIRPFHVRDGMVLGATVGFGFAALEAILGAAIFSAAARRGRLRLSGGVIGTYLAVSVLHGAFDSINGILGYVVVSLIGLVPLIWLWRRADGGGVLPRRRQSIPVTASVTS
jgi:RsiW-degrading membrane proteinase PrsW (M82 family)